jgi:hypothetical protein
MPRNIRGAAGRALTACFVAHALACGHEGAPAGRPRDAAADRSNPDEPDALAPPVGTARIKFCNRLMRGSMPATMTLEVGAQPLVLAAATDTCNTAAGAPCVPLREGPARLVLIDDRDQILDEARIVVGRAEEWLAVATVSGVPRRLSVVVRPLVRPETCATEDPFSGPDASAAEDPPDAGAPVDAAARF